MVAVPCYQILLLFALVLHILKCSRKAAEVHTYTQLLYIVHIYWLGFTLERERKRKESKKKKEKNKKKMDCSLCFFIVSGGVFVISFVSRLAPLAWFRLGLA